MTLFSTIVGFRIMVFDLGSGSRGLGDVAVTVLWQDLAIERAAMDSCVAAKGLEPPRDSSRLESNDQLGSRPPRTRAQH